MLNPLNKSPWPMKSATLLKWIVGCLCFLPGHATPAQALDGAPPAFWK